MINGKCLLAYTLQTSFDSLTVNCRKHQNFPLINLVLYGMLCSFLILICVGVPNVTVVVDDNASTNVMFGSSFNITCQPSSPTASITWRSDNTIISNSSSMTVSIDRFSVEYFTDDNGLVTRSILTNIMAVLSDSATYHCTSTVEDTQSTDNITIFVYGKYYVFL